MLPLYVTSGEPAGIGPDICLNLANRQDLRPVVVLADIDMLKQRIEQLGLEVELVLYSGQTEPSLNGQLYVDICLAKPVILGSLDAENASYVLEQFVVQLIMRCLEKA
jgi:4-hydroxythreonine-4-phosphate dehydrogenase